jgi:conjugal transfer pilus assembly protein TraW
MVRFILLVSLYALSSAKARDCGTHGPLFPVDEKDPIALIHQKLKNMEETGDLSHYEAEAHKKIKSSVERPAPVKGITKAIQSRTFYYDPTFVVEHDLKDHQGKVFAKKGTKINPLEKISLSSSLLFFDGGDPEQLAWVQTQLKDQKNSLTLILTNGSPLQLAEEVGQAVYFDQGGLLTKKLGIIHTPASVSQEGLRLRIEEVCISSRSFGGIQ